MPTVAHGSLKSDAETAFKAVMNTDSGAIPYVIGIIAFFITSRIVYNGAGIAMRNGLTIWIACASSAQKASARISSLGELAIVTLVVLPLGGVLGYCLSIGIAAGFPSELQQIPRHLQSGQLRLRGDGGGWRSCRLGSVDTAVAAISRREAQSPGSRPSATKNSA